MGENPQVCLWDESRFRITEFEAHYNKEKALITWIKANKIKILNSGIKVA